MVPLDPIEVDVTMGGATMELLLQVVGRILLAEFLKLNMSEKAKFD